MLTLRFGFAGSSEHTLKEIGVMYGLCRESIRRIQCNALLKLRKLWDVNNNCAKATTLAELRSAVEKYMRNEESRRRLQTIKFSKWLEQRKEAGASTIKRITA